jgi:CHRD domain
VRSAGLRGAVSTGATGKFRARIDQSNSMIHYELSSQGLEAAVTQAHIHFGQRHTVAGIVVSLCQTPLGSVGNTPAPEAVHAVDVTPVCPQEGTVEGTITPAQVLAATGQGLNTGEFAEVLAAIRAGATYANVHSTLFPPGEIRGHIHSGQGHRD